MSEENLKAVRAWETLASAHAVSWTGEVLADVGGASVIASSDGERMDRDYNGARGIYLRALGDTPALRTWFSACAASVDDSRLSGNVRAVA